MLIYKANHSNHILLVAVVIAILATPILFINDKSFFQILIISSVISAFLLYHLLAKRISVIKIDERKEELILVYRNHFKLISTQILNLNKIKFSNKTIPITYRGGTQEVCIIYSAEQKVITVRPFDFGWGQDEVDSLIRGLISANVETK
ncbi:MAG: hypothetical protein QNK23_08565 [Crocinitomicaceae bacterium]|nr:hypothetical protein [Crocinitomicaceae bacterium]